MYPQRVVALVHPKSHEVQPLQNPVLVLHPPSETAMPIIVLLGEPLQPSRNRKCLGILFDRRCSFHAHAEYLKRKMSQRLLTIRKLATTHWGASPQVMRTLVRGTLLPPATYRASSWGPFVYNNCSKTHRINRIFRIAAIAITATLRTSSFTEVMHLAGLESFEALLRTEILKKAGNWSYEQLSPNPLARRIPLVS